MTRTTALHRCCQRRSDDRRRNRCVLEVNTSAAYRGFRKDYFPSDAILKDWLILSGNVVITADAHDAKALTYGFEKPPPLKELGYTKVQVLGKDGFILAHCKNILKFPAAV